MKTAALLTPDERVEFAGWLRVRLEQLGLSKKRFSQLLSGPDVEKENISTLNAQRYLDKGMIPGPVMLVRIARIVEEPWPVVLWRAGCFREVLGAIDVISLTDGASDLAIDLALAMFPRRDVAPPAMELADCLSSSALIQAISSSDVVPPETKGDFALLTGRLDPALTRASNALADTFYNAIARRYIAAEHVNAWADGLDFGHAEHARDRIREFSLRTDLTQRIMSGKAAERSKA